MENLNILSCISSIVVFILLVAPGYVVTHKKMLSPTQVDGFSILLVNLIWPAMIIDAMASVSINKELLHMALSTAGVSFMVYITSLGISFLRAKVTKMPLNIAGIYMFAIAFNNTGLIGMPFIKAILGDKALFIASIVELVNDIFIFSLGIMLIQPPSAIKKKIDFRFLISPTFVSVLIGLIIFGFHLQLPTILGNTLSYLADATVAISMLVIGLQLGEISIFDLFKEKRAYEVSLCRLVVIPSIIFCILFLVLKERNLASTVIVLMYAMPAASCTAIFARQYKGDYQLATKFVMLSTIYSVFTLPVWLMLTNYYLSK